MPTADELFRQNFGSLVNSAREVRASLEKNGTVNGNTQNQNLAAVIKQPGNTTTTTATPYINSSGQTDYHISGNPDTGGRSNPNIATGYEGTLPGGTGLAQFRGNNNNNQGMQQYVPPAPTGLNFDQAKGQVSQQLDPMFKKALEALQAQKYQDQLNGDQLGMARGGAHSGLAADLQNKVGIAAAGKASDLDAQKQSQIAQMAQDLVKYGQDYDLRNKQAALAEYLGLNNLDLQKQGQQADYTGIFNGMQTMQSRNADRGYGLDLAGLSGMLPGGGQTLAAQGQSFNQGMAQKGANWNAYKDAVDMTGNLGSGPKSDWGQLPGQTGQPSYPAQQQNAQNTAQYTGYYQGIPTMQKIMNDNTITNMNADNLRQASAEARAAGQQELATKFDIWDRTGKAPDGIPGVAPGTGLPGKTPTTLKESDIADLIDKSPYIQKKYDNTGKVIGTAVDPNQKQALSQYIASFGLPPEQAKQWFIRYGLWSPSGN